MIIIEISGLAGDCVPNDLAKARGDIDHFLGKFGFSDKRHSHVFFTSSTLGIGGRLFMEDKIFVKLYYTKDEKGCIDNKKFFSMSVFDEVREHIDSNLKSAICIFIPVKKEDYIVFE